MNYLIYFLSLIADATKAGMMNIIHNPTTLILFTIATILVLTVKKLKPVIVVIVLLYALGYGNLLYQGFSMLLQAGEKLL